METFHRIAYLIVGVKAYDGFHLVSSQIEENKALVSKQYIALFHLKRAASHPSVSVVRRKSDHQLFPLAPLLKGLSGALG